MGPTTKPWWSSKTVWVNVLTVVIALAAWLAQQPTLQHYAEPLLMAVGVLNIVLRAITDRPLSWIADRPLS